MADELIRLNEPPKAGWGPWRGPDTSRRPKPMSNECLAALREAAAEKARRVADPSKRSLTQKETDEIVARFK